MAAQRPVTPYVDDSKNAPLPSRYKHHFDPLIAPAAATEEAAVLVVLTVIDIVTT